MLASGIALNSILGGLQGFLYSTYGIGIAFILMTVLPGFRHGGGDIKLGMGFGAYMGWENTIILILLTLAIIALVNIAMILKRDGIKGFLKSLKIEICSMGKLKTEGSKIIEGPIILIAYVIALLFIGK